MLMWKFHFNYIYRTLSKSRLDSQASHALPAKAGDETSSLPSRRSRHFVMQINCKLDKFSSPTTCMLITTGPPKCEELRTWWIKVDYGRAQDLPTQARLRIRSDESRTFHLCNWIQFRIQNPLSTLHQEANVSSRVSTKCNAYVPIWLSLIVELLLVSITNGTVCLQRRARESERAWIRENVKQAKWWKATQIPSGKEVAPAASY